MSWARVATRGDRPYHTPPDLPGFGEVGDAVRNHGDVPATLLWVSFLPRGAGS